MAQKNYKDTLNLPRIDFPMKANLATREPELYFLSRAETEIILAVVARDEMQSP